jgi:hypothetical protein
MLISEMVVPIVELAFAVFILQHHLPPFVLLEVEARLDVRLQELLPWVHFFCLIHDDSSLGVP